MNTHFSACAKVCCLFLIAGVMAAGCAAPKAMLDAGHNPSILLQVPFFPDNADQCGPSALASVLGFWGMATELTKLREELYQSHLKGALTADLLLVAENRGLTAEMINGDLPRIKAELDAGRPVIVFVDVGYFFYSKGHFMVVIGYDDQLESVFVHSGMNRSQRMLYKKLEKQWKKTDRWALLIKSPKPL